MKKICVLFALVFVFLAVSCSPSRSDPLAALKNEGRAEIVIEKNGCRAGGIITLGAVPDEGERDLTLTLTSPETVKGTVIKRLYGKTTATREGLSFDTGAFDAVFALFSPAGVGEASVTSRDGIKLTKVASNANGRSVNIYLSGEGIPVLIEAEELCVRIVWFEAE